MACSLVSCDVQSTVGEWNAVRASSESCASSAEVVSNAVHHDETKRMTSSIRIFFFLSFSSLDALNNSLMV